MNWKQQLQKNHLRATPIRETVLGILEEADSPLDTQEVLSVLASQQITCDLVTIYRMMDTFVKKGLVKQVDFQDGKFRYELEGDHHHHLVCTECGSVKAIHEPCVAVSEALVMNKYAFQITRHQLEFFGFCDRCLKNSDKKTQV